MAILFWAQLGVFFPNLTKNDFSNEQMRSNIPTVETNHRFKQYWVLFDQKNLKSIFEVPPVPLFSAPEIGKNSFYKHFLRKNCGFWVKRPKIFFDEMNEVLRLQQKIYDMGSGIFANFSQWTHKIGFDEKCPNFNLKIVQSATFSQKSASGFYIKNSCILKGLNRIFGEMARNGLFQSPFLLFFRILSKIWSSEKNELLEMITMLYHK